MLGTALENPTPTIGAPIPPGLLEVPTAGGGDFYNNLLRRKLQSEEILSDWPDTPGGGTLTWDYDPRYWEQPFVQPWN
jgi:hypothetical protein